MKKIGLLLLCTLLPLFPLGAKKKVHDPEIPILAWYSIPGGKFATEEHYQELKDCGFTYSFAHIYKYEGTILVSTLVNGGKHYVQIVNTSPAHYAQFQLLTDDRVSLIRRDATTQPAILYESLHILAPGDTEIYTY